MEVATKRVSDELLKQFGGVMLYEPQEYQRPFWESRVRSRVIAGGNQSGKTLDVCAWIACAAMGLIEWVNEKWVDEKLNITLVAKDWDTVGKVFYAKFFESDAFDYWECEEHGDGMLECCDECEDGRHDAREDHLPCIRAQRLTVPPLIPPSMIREMVWHNKGRRIPMSVTLSTGHSLYFGSGEQDKQSYAGMQRHIVATDEQLGRNAHDIWIELQRSLLRKGGLALVSLCPDQPEQHAKDLFFRAGHFWSRGEEKKAPGEDAETNSFQYFSIDNQGIALEYREQWEKELRMSASEAEVDARLYGDFVYFSGLVYSDFNDDKHVLEPFDYPLNRNDWCMYESIDPGRAHPAVCLFIAYHRPTEEQPKGYAVICEEIYRTGLVVDRHASMIRAVRDMIGLDPVDTIIDAWQGKKHMEFEKSLWDLYQEGDVYVTPCPRERKKFRILQTAGWLAPEEGPPRLFITENCISTLKEIRNYSWKPGKEEPQDRNDHSMDAMMNRVTAGMRWIEAPVVKRPVKKLPPYVRDFHKARHKVRTSPLAI